MTREPKDDDLDRRLDADMRFHIEQQTEKNIRDGMEPGAARRAAQLKFGGIERTREYTGDAFRWAALHEFARDLKIAVRGWRRWRGAALVAIVTLAIGIGANTAMFSVLRALVLNPLPFPEVERVVSIWDATEKNPHNAIAYANFADWKAEQKSFEALGLYRWWTANITGDQTPERVQGFQFTAEALPALGLKPLIGRWFRPEENDAEGDRVALLSYGLWQRRYGGRADIVGTTIVVNDVPRQIIGVMPPRMNFPPNAEILAPMRVTADIKANRKAHTYYVVGRVKPGVSVADANADITAIAERLARTYPDTNRGLSARVYPLAQDIATPYRNGIWLLMASVGFVLLIACANLANILLAREPGRVRELAVRASIGATRGRLIRQLVAESLALSMIGGALGAVIATFGVRALRLAAPADVVASVPGLAGLTVDLSVLGFTSALSILTGLVFGLLPALRASAAETTLALRESRRSLGSISGTRVRGVLVAAEVAIALILLSGAATTLRAFSRMASLDLGFDRAKVVTMGVSLPYARYGTDEMQTRFFQSLLDHARATQGIESVGLTSHIPLAPGNASNSLVLEGREAPAQEPEADYRVISAGYFEAIGARMANGRVFATTDTSESPRVMIVNEAFVRRFYAGLDPVGRRVRFSGPPAENPWREIVGVVKDLRHEITRDPHPETYIPYTQGVEGTLFVVAKTRAPGLAMAASLREAVKGVDVNQPVWAVRTLDDIHARSLAAFRAMVGFIGTFGAIAMLLSAVGIFGVVSFLVSSRTQEIGLRMALGARAADVVGLVMSQSSGALAVGLTFGSIGAVLTGRVLAGAFPEIRSADPWSVVPTALLLAATATLAAWLPARKAASIAPTDALRAD